MTSSTTDLPSASVTDALPAVRRARAASEVVEAGATGATGGTGPDAGPANTTAPTDDLTLLQRIGRGESDAVEAALDAFGPLVWSIARRHHPDRGEAEDVVQEVFIDLWRTASRFDPSMGAESTFVGTIAHRRCIDRHRRAQARPRFEDVEPALDGAGIELGGADPALRDQGLATVEREDERTALERHLRALRPIQRRVIEMCFFQGRSHSQVADLLEMPLGTVKTHARRGLKRLREQLEGTGLAASMV